MPVALPELIPRLRAARFLLLGEVHGNRKHHDVQVRILKALRESGVRLVAGLEAFPAAATPGLALWTEGRLDDDELFRLFDTGWASENWPAYRDLFYFLRDHRIPSAGINAEETLISRVARGGLVSLNPAALGGLPPGGCVVDERYRALMARVLGSGTSHDRIFSNFCEAQSLRDAFLARSLNQLAIAHPRHLVAGLTGQFHAWKPAVPRRLRELNEGQIVVILPEEVLLQPVEDLLLEADYFWSWQD